MGNQEIRPNSIHICGSSESIKVVLLGLGSVATETHSGGHLKQYLNDPQINVVAGVDPLKEAREEALLKGIPIVYSTFEEVIKNEEFEFVSILTPTDKHLECCRLAALAKKDILCEKPLASSLEEAIEIENHIKNSGVFLSVNMNLRFLPIVNQIFNDINDGNFGHLFFLDFDECTSFKWSTYCNRNSKNYHIASESFWGNPKNYGLQRLIIFDKVIHFIDLINLWTGKDVLSIYAQGGCQGNHLDAGDNFSSVSMTLINGIRCRLLNIWGSHFNDKAGGELSTRIRIFGDKGTGIYESYKKGEVGIYSIYKNEKKIKSMEFPQIERTDFADSLKALAISKWRGEKNGKNLESAIKLIRMIEACYQSIETNSCIIL